MADPGFFDKIFGARLDSSTKVKQKRKEKHAPPENSYQLKQNTPKPYNCLVCSKPLSSNAVWYPFIEECQSINPDDYSSFENLNMYPFMLKIEHDTQTRTITDHKDLIKFVKHFPCKYTGLRNSYVRACPVHGSVSMQLLRHLVDLFLLRKEILEEYHNAMRKVTTGIKNVKENLNSSLAKINSESNSNQSFSSNYSDLVNDVDRFVKESVVLFLDFITKDIVPEHYNVISLSYNRHINRVSSEIPDPEITIKDGKIIEDTKLIAYLLNQRKEFANLTNAMSEQMIERLSDFDNLILPDASQEISFEGTLELVSNHIENRIKTFTEDYFSLAGFVHVDTLINSLNIDNLDYESKDHHLFAILDKELINMVRSQAEIRSLELSDEYVSRRDIVEDFINKVADKTNEMKSKFQNKEYIDQKALNQIERDAEVIEFISESIYKSAGKIGVNLPESKNVEYLAKVFESKSKKKFAEAQQKAKQYNLPVSMDQSNSVFKYLKLFDKQFNDVLSGLRKTAKENNIPLPRTKDLNKLKETIGETLEKRKHRTEEILEKAKQHQLPMANTQERNLSKLETLYKEQYIEAKKLLLPSVKDLGIQVNNKTPLEKLRLHMNRHQRRSGLIRAGFSEEIIQQYVQDEISEISIKRIAKNFGKKHSIVNWSSAIIDVLRNSSRGKLWQKEHFMLTNIDTKVSDSADLISLMVEKIEQNPDIFRYAIELGGTNFSNEDFDFLLRCNDDLGLKMLYENVMFHEFDFNLAKSMVVDWGFDKHPEAIKEVIEGADLEMIALMYGLSQV